MDLGTVIRTARQEKGLSLRVVADNTGISYSQISKIERGEHKPSKEKAIKLAHTLNIRPELLSRLLGYEIKNSNIPYIENKARYETLMRDNFSCKLCGRKAPDVELVVAHIIPEKDEGIAEGNQSLHNLVTLCRDCKEGRDLFIAEEGIEKEHLYIKGKLRHLLQE
ncbi:helix-turn-helix domain-containing protein [Rossellomorea marisflavi]|uniref:helix-turn-helix domain-containing protein n=1 Tax=Rossellomorea marisflavi TaxID=189381 RepID=UPI003458B578